MIAEHYRLHALALQRTARDFHEISLQVIEAGHGDRVAAGDQRISWRYHRESQACVDAWLDAGRSNASEGAPTARMRAVAVVTSEKAKHRVLTDAAEPTDGEA